MWLYGQKIKIFSPSQGVFDIKINKSWYFSRSKGSIPLVTTETGLEKHLYSNSTYGYTNFDGYSA